METKKHSSQWYTNSRDSSDLQTRSRKPLLEYNNARLTTWVQSHLKDDHATIFSRKHGTMQRQQCEMETRKHWSQWYTSSRSWSCLQTRSRKPLLEYNDARLVTWVQTHLKDHHATLLSGLWNNSKTTCGMETRKHLSQWVFTWEQNQLKDAATRNKIPCFTWLWFSCFQ